MDLKTNNYKNTFLTSRYTIHMERRSISFISRQYSPIHTKKYGNPLKVTRHVHLSRDELIRDVLLWIPTHGRAKAGRPARTYIQQLCEDTGCCPEDLPRAMNDREEWRERVRDIRAASTIWWWWYLLFIPVLVSHFLSHTYIHTYTQGWKIRLPYTERDLEQSEMQTTRFELRLLILFPTMILFC